ncbi:MAG: DUF1801 domain-containing protein [Bacteroidia bacterium]|nr:DUF1801 domain-containing protein [Bacteroidia bacterium]
MARNFESVDQYLDEFTGLEHLKLQELRQFLLEIIPQAQEAISYQMPSYRKNQILIWFAGCKNHFSIYMKPMFYSGFEEELKKFDRTKSAIHFAWNLPLEKDLITELVQNAMAIDAKIPAKGSARKVKSKV